MLNVFRENLPRLKPLLWIVAISFVLYLGVYFTGDPDAVADGAWAARVDGEPIPVEAVRDEARRRDQAYREMFGEQFDMIKGQIHVGREAVQALVLRRIMLEQAREMGLEATPAEIAHAIQTSPDLKDESGRFIGKERYTQVVSQQYPGGVQAYERARGEDITIRKWQALVTEAAFVSDEELERVYRERNERAEVDYAIVPAASQSIDTRVTDQQARAWYDAHQDTYRRPESRRIRLVVVERAAQAAKVQVTDEQVRAFYEANGADFATPEQRRARHILLTVPPDASAAQRGAVRDRAEALLARARAGEDFAALARSSSQDTATAAAGGDLGLVSRGDRVPALDAAIFSTPPGQLAGVVESALGFHVVQVTESRPAGARPLEQVQEEIRRQLQVQGAQERVASEASRIRARIGSPDQMQSVAQAETLQVQELTVARGERLEQLGPSPEFVDQVFRLSPGAVSQPLGVARGQAIVAVLEALPAAVRPFAEVAQQVRSDVLNQRAREAALARARAALERHRELRATARTLGVEVKSSGPLAAGQALPGAGGAVPELTEALFRPGVSQGATGVVPAPGGALLYAVTRLQRFDPAGFAAAQPQLRRELLQTRGQALLQSVLQKLQAEHQVEINQAVVDQFRS